MSTTQMNFKQRAQAAEAAYVTTMERIKNIFSRTKSNTSWYYGNKVRAHLLSTRDFIIEFMNEEKKTIHVFYFNQVEDPELSDTRILNNFQEHAVLLDSSNVWSTASLPSSSLFGLIDDLVTFVMPGVTVVSRIEPEDS